MATASCLRFVCAFSIKLAGCWLVSLASRLPMYGTSKLGFTWLVHHQQLYKPIVLHYTVLDHIRLFGFCMVLSSIKYIFSFFAVTGTETVPRVVSVAPIGLLCSICLLLLVTYML
uniref:Putative secreted peptide n=1 Tax=Anopheles braziliensis TaxID=58242 RepID=A0A2M3ZUE7_9DIPT